MTDATVSAARAPSAAPPSFTMPTLERVRAHYGPLCVAARRSFDGSLMDGPRAGGSLAGCFLLVDGLAREGDALLIAASIAGAASLTLETQADAIRHCVRNGIVDFAVNTLDEALRVLKNEIRKQQPIAVLLEQEPAIALPALVERGAQPNLLRWAESAEQEGRAGGISGLAAAVAMLRQRGAQPVPEPIAENPITDDEVCWRAGDGGSAVLRQLDLLAAQALPEEDGERQNWILRAPRYLPRALRLERCVAMSETEAKLFLAAVTDSAQQGTLAARVEAKIAGHSHVFEDKVL